MGIIENFNSDRKCTEEYCNKDYTHFIPISLGDIKILIPLCEDHYENVMTIISQQLKGRIEECQLNFLQ